MCLRTQYGGDRKKTREKTFTRGAGENADSPEVNTHQLPHPPLEPLMLDVRNQPGLHVSI